MKALRSLRTTPHGRKRGAALLLSLLILLVLVAIVIQINVSTNTDARVARNDVGQTTMDLAIESALLQVDDKLKVDGEADGAGAGAGAAPGAPLADPSAPAAPAAGGTAPGQPAQATDSRRDDWATTQRTDINEIKLKIIVQDEDSKINVLNMLNPDEKEAEAAFDRVVRCLDLCRDGTSADIDSRRAEEMTKAMLEHMQRRKLSKLPRPKLLTDDEKQDTGLPISLREFGVLPPFEESDFRDFRDENGEIVHSISSFLTVWSSLSTAGEISGTQTAATGAGGSASGATGGAANKSGTSGGNAGSKSKSGTGAAASTANGSKSGGSTTAGNTASGSQASNPQSGGTAPAAAAAGGTPTTASTSSGGYAVNVNTAPMAVLKALFDDREVHPRFWDKVVEYRNLEEPEDDKSEAEDELPMLDEYGNEVIKRRIFDSTTELNEVDGFKDLPVEVQTKIGLMVATKSHVFSIYVVARRTTSADGDTAEELGGGARERAKEEEQGDALVRVVRSVVWRHKVADKVELTPIVRWEVLDYAPFEVLDYPDEER